MKTKLLSLVLIATQLHVLAGGPPADGFVAHEWGTFTSVQGADGVLLEWNPLVVTELPGFVYDRNRPTAGPRARLPSALLSKSEFVTLQRMETPVIYFYSDRERAVDVRVKFPQGTVTEWYPRVTPPSPTPATDQDKGLALRWDGVQILPRRLNEPAELRLPWDKSGSHYYAARETDSDYVRVSGNTGTPATAEHEKFLFYRGVGSFRTPLQVTLAGNEDQVTVRNTGTEALTDLFVLNVSQDRSQGRFIPIERLAPDETKTVKLSPPSDLVPLSDLRAQLARRMQEALARQGLYAPEASAMVKTWDDSWFGEAGLRVLYLLPQTWTDQTLPLEIKPTPRELVRVMVGRAELITPTMEWQLLKQVVKFTENGAASRRRIAEQTRDLALGRFAEPAVRRILGRHPSREFSQGAWDLLEALGQLDSSGKGFAAK